MNFQTAPFALFKLLVAVVSLSAYNRASNPLSRFHQKRAIKKQYIATRYGKGAKTAQNTATAAKSAVKKGADAVGNAVAAMAKNPKVLLIILALFLLISVIAGAVSSCSVLFQGAMSSMVSTSYTSENEELIAANEDYTALETALQAQIDNVERDYPIMTSTATI